jgi:uncharacterized protein YecT (DUF1311 family)
MKMTRSKILVTFILCLPSSFLFGQTQAQLTNDSSERLKKVEAELSSVYNRVLETYADDKEFITNIKQSQELWAKFKTAELKMKYPDRSAGYYGSTHQMCVNDYLAQLTNERIKRLRDWLTGMPDGDVCSGSIKPRLN